MHVWYVRAPWSDVRAVPRELSPSGLHLCLIASATVSDTCNKSVNPFYYQALRHGTFHPPPTALPSWLSYSCRDPASSSAVLSCNTERMALMLISASTFVVRFLPWSISAGDGSPIPIRVVLKSAKTSWNDCVFELFESMFLTVCMCRSMKPLEWGYPGDEVVCLMPKPERNLANSLLWNSGPLSDTISSGLIPFNWKEID